MKESEIQQIDSFEHMIEDLVEEDLIPEAFIKHVPKLRTLFSRSLVQHTEDYEYALGIKERPELPGTRKLYAVHYKVLASTTNPESVTDRVINFGVEGENVLEAVDYFLRFVLAKGTEIDIVKVELEQTFETAEDVQEALDNPEVLESMNSVNSRD
jgi:hypothetical protein